MNGLVESKEVIKIHQIELKLQTKINGLLISSMESLIKMKKCHKGQYCHFNFQIQIPFFEFYSILRNIYLNLQFERRIQFEMIKRQEEQVYFFSVKFANFIPTLDHIKRIDRNSHIYALITKESVNDMFISEVKNIARFDVSVKCFVYQGKISLGQNTLSFNLKLTDLAKNNTFFIKIFLINNHTETQLTYFKFFVNKYVEAKQLEGKNYFEENFLEKTGARVECQVFIEKDRAALQMLIMDVKSEKKKRQSLSARKKRQEKMSAQQRDEKVLTIEKLYQKSKEEKNLLKTMQRAQIRKSTQQLKRKNSKLSEFQQQQDDDDPQVNIRKTSKDPENPAQKIDKSLINSRHVKEKHNKLDISRISQVINSEIAEDPEKENALEKQSESQFRQKRSEATEFVLQELNLSQAGGKKELPRMTEEISQSSSIFPSDSKKPTQQKTSKQPTNSVSSISGLSTTTLSRSFIGAIQLDSEAASEAHSSELSAKSEVQKLVLKRNKLFWGLLIVFALVAIFFLMVPTKSPRIGKMISNKGRQNQ